MTKIVTKPWGREEWLELNDKYCYKRIYIKAGTRTSLQYHEKKHECNYIIEGQAEVWLEDDNGEIEKTEMETGDFFTVSPPRKHRVVALTDLILQEVSTPEIDDVIRIEDDTGRPDGRLENEHNKPAFVILAAGLGSRLGRLTDNCHKALLPLGDKAILSHILEKVPENTDIIICIGHLKQQVIDYCKYAHPDLKIDFVDVDNYQGEGSGPGFSLLMAKSLLKRPFYICTTDTLTEEEFPNLSENWLGIKQTGLPELFSTVNINNKGDIVAFKNKDKQGYMWAFIGLAGIRDYSQFWNELESRMENGELVCAFEKPFNWNGLKGKEFTWHDTGTLDNYRQTLEKYGKNNLGLIKKNGQKNFRVNNRMIKFFPNKEKVNRLVESSKRLSGMTPKIISDLDSNFLAYEWVNGNTLYEIDQVETCETFFDLYLSKVSVLPKEVDYENFLKEKVLDRLALLDDNIVKKPLRINGKTHSSIEESLNSIWDNGYFISPEVTFFHGDLQWDNILLNSCGDFNLIDWREDFDGKIDKGAFYYDLAKLLGGTILDYNRCKSEEALLVLSSDGIINYNYDNWNKLSKFLPFLIKRVEKYNFNWELWLALIFLSMAPLHEEKFSKLLIAKGAELLGHRP